MRIAMLDDCHARRAIPACRKNVPVTTITKVIITVASNDHTTITAVLPDKNILAMNGDIHIIVIPDRKIQITKNNISSKNHLIKPYPDVFINV
jgi:hypothetical protein